MRVTYTTTANVLLAFGRSPHARVSRDAPDDESESNPDTAFETWRDRPDLSDELHRFAR